MEKAKIVHDHHTLSTIIEQHKQEGKTIVFTNGCFDLLHVGHIRCLAGAKEQGDILVVALNSDTSVNASKRKGRPLMSEDERLEIMSSIIYVDYLTVFSEPTVDTLLRLLRPHVYAKGTDYRAENLPERETAQQIKARLAFVGDPKDHSTSTFIEKIKLLAE
ncbi:MAG TPA: adenylyltransferase/cytidyltransferase family protein [Thermodesulfobacteriota bacterium]|nr:adenylyltransferase/cytidyltransferase family protein [Thermodesulfobacteriota bacterium]HNU72547.1 adenylyltransferase/cytidyltransferase family protein [Thermodesulfobacteriota bacterium]HQO77912.1 adenylyltransferase/cytidyltransferase family protein [Thermodesulfobacteriota bacterium]